MIEPGYLRMMARFSRWRTDRMLTSCDGLDDAARRQDRSLFFGSIHATLNHVLWADQIWLWRFGAADRPGARSIADSTTTHDGWAELSAARRAFDDHLVAWADGVARDARELDLVWDSAATGKRLRQPRALAAAHIFN
ncbi:MAG: DinB family protein, partial [Pseudomonadota bacterium]